MFKIQQKVMELEMEAEKNSILNDNHGVNGNTAFGSLEHGGDERGQEVFNAFKWQQDGLSEPKRQPTAQSNFPTIGPARRPGGSALSDLNVTMGSNKDATMHNSQSN